MKYLLSLFLLSLSLSSIAAECPPKQLGVITLNSINSGKIFLSVGKASSLSELPESLDLAAEQAKLIARDQLIKANVLNADKKGNLRGAFNVSICINGLNVYALVSVTEKSMQQSNKLSNSIENSFIKYPVQ